MVFQRAVALVSLVLGIGIIILGLIIGSTPDRVSYQQVGQEPVVRFITARDGTGYLQIVGDPTVYIVDTNLFSPKIDSHWLFSQGYQQVGIIYDKNQIIPVHARARDTKELIEGEGYPIVSITFINDAGAQQTFDTEEYKQHPDDYDPDDWPIGLAVIGIGIILIRASAGLSNLEEGASSYLKVAFDGPLAYQYFVDTALEETSTVPLSLEASRSSQPSVELKGNLSAVNKVPLQW